MRSLRKGEIIKFSAMDDFTGNEMKLVGEVIGDHEAVKKQFPEECAEAEEGFYLVKVENRSGLFVIAMDEVLESLGIKEEHETEEPLPDDDPQEDDDEFEEHERQVFRDAGIDEETK